MEDYPEKRFLGYVGMPKALYLDMFGRYVRDMFDSDVFLVGSALKTKDWKDIDVVVVISDSLWNNLGFGDPSNRFKNKKWISYCLSISSFGKSLLGCEVDFQIHSKTHSETIHTNDPKCEIGL